MLPKKAGIRLVRAYGEAHYPRLTVHSAERINNNWVITAFYEDEHKLFQVQYVVLAEGTIVPIPFVE